MGRWLYPGSFDPLTLGHMDIIERATALCDELVVAIGVHDAKTPWIDAQGRISIIREVVGDMKNAHKVKVITFSGLLVDTVIEQGATAILRGIRDASDYDYEVQMMGMNSVLKPGIETIFLPASPHVRHIASRFVRQIRGMGGDIRPFVPPSVISFLETNKK